jgi:tRNA modification GTPase
MSGLTDTIFARASGPGIAAITVLRISGSRAGSVILGLTGSLPPPRRASLRRLRSPIDGDTLDKALVLWFPAPNSYTGEDSGELHLHGGRAVSAAVEAALLALGCRPAEAGEFTRRAFLHDRIDLTQAEAIADLIEAETDAQRRQALRQAGGALAGLYGAWAQRLTSILAQQEAAIEFEMDDLPNDLPARAQAEATLLEAEIAAHLADGARGERLREGLSVTIVGAPNAGKSSLLNALVGREAAIVSSQPGTTRDIVECRLVLTGVPVTLADTAGLRDATDFVEQEGVRRAERRAGATDILLAAFACDQPADEPTLALLDSAAQAVVVATKCDLASAPLQVAGRSAVPISVLTGAGLPALHAALAEIVGRLAGASDVPTLTRTRHRAALCRALDRLWEARDATLAEVKAEGFRAALQAIGQLTGRVGVEQVLDAVFRDFCIGK